MLKRIVIVLFVGLCCLTGLQAQTLSKTNIEKFSPKNLGPIVQNGQVKGHFFLYTLEKEDRKNDNYLLTVTDENLREINSVTITRPKTYLMIEGAFNGEAFGFLFYDSRNKALELVSFDRTLKETGKVQKEIKNKYTNAAYGYIAQGNMPMQAFMVAVPNKGFVYYGIQEETKSDYEIEYYDNQMKRVWVAKADATDKYDFETAAEALQHEQYIGSVVMKRTNIMSTDVEMDLVVQSVADGSQLFRVPMNTPKGYKVALSDISYDPAKQQFTIFGEYYTEKQNIIKDESLGFITVMLDAKGKVVSEKINSWDNIAKAVDTKDKSRYERTDVFVHEYLRTADGQTFVIGEQYKRGGIPTAPKINVFNMVILQFDATGTIKKVNIFEKDKNSTQPQLGAAAMMMSTKMLGYVAKSMGGFDYVFYQMSPDNNTFIASYINYDKEKGEKAKNVLGSVVYTPEKVFTVDKLPLERKSSVLYVGRAKAGYVFVAEYFQKEKRLGIRLEKINY
jgi:hypothetical protein